MRFLIKFSYDGTNYSGFQAQKGLDTIEKRMNDALTKINNSASSFKSFVISNASLLILFEIKLANFNVLPFLLFVKYLIVNSICAPLLDCMQFNFILFNICCQLFYK